MRTIKTLGIATAMALALVAFAGAGAASANKFKTEVVGPVDWTGELNGKEHQLIVNETFECSKVSFSGATPPSVSAFTEQTVTPELGSCRFRGIFYVNWKMNGCKFNFRAGPAPGFGGLVGSVDIVGCEKPMSMEYQGCRIEIGNQNSIGTVEYANVASSPTTVTASASFSGIAYTMNTCSSYPNGTYQNGIYSGTWTIKALKSGVQKGAEIESTPAPPISKFAVQEAPATISGADVGTGYQWRIKNNGGNDLYCKSYTLNGAETNLTFGAITLTPSYKECGVYEEVVPDSFVTAGGCSYVFHIDGTFDVAGATCASNPISMTRSGCVTTIGPQSGLKSVTISRKGSGRTRELEFTGVVNGVTYTTVGPKCITPGTYSNGTIRPLAKLKATNSLKAPQGLWFE